jgi:hypothetical protein
MAQAILFPTQNVTSDPLTDPLETVSFDKIEQENIELNVSLGFGSSNLVINIINTDITNLDLEYSLDSENWFSSNTFEITESGNYTAYIRDKFSCTKSKSFSVDQIKRRIDFIDIPDGNSIPFVKVEDTDSLSLFENEENLFECESQVMFPYSSDVLFQNKDKPSLQVKSNLDTIDVFLRKEDESSTKILMSKRSSNLNKNLKLDCFSYSHSSGRLAIYFQEGNTYDNEGNVNGTHELKGNLPEFATIGNYVEVGSIGTFQISSILIDYTINKKAIIFEEQYLEAESSTTALSIYDLLNFEVYEHYFDFSKLEEGYYDVYIKGTSSLGKVYEYLSENILIKEKHEKTFAIHYYNEDNKDFFYKYGLINQLRQKYSDFERYNKSENEINVNDNSSSLIKSFLNFGYKYSFEELSNKKLDILSIALSSESVFINGIGYIKDSQDSIEKIENTNVYKLEAQMLKTNVKLVLSRSRLSVLDYLMPNIFPSI